MRLHDLKNRRHVRFTDGCSDEVFKVTRRDSGFWGKIVYLLDKQGTPRYYFRPSTQDVPLEYAII